MKPSAKRNIQKVIMKPSAKRNTVLDCIDEDIFVRGSDHCRFIIFVVLFVPSCCRDFKILHAKKEAQEAFDEEIN
jgi:hypothetical protein